MFFRSRLSSNAGYYNKKTGVQQFERVQALQLWMLAEVNAALSHRTSGLQRPFQVDVNGYQKDEWWTRSCVSTLLIKLVCFQSSLTSSLSAFWGVTVVDKVPVWQLLLQEWL